MTITSPFPLELVPLAWQWLQEFPQANFDDYGPQTFNQFEPHMQWRVTTERTWAVFKEGQPCGVVGYAPITPRLGALHGICFAKGLCTRDEKREAVRLILRELFDSGVAKICATFFADNSKIGPFLSDLGALEEGYLRQHTLRDGQPINMVQVAIFSSRV